VSIMNSRILLYVLCAIVGTLAMPLMFGMLPPNPRVGIRFAALLGNPTTWYVVHGVFGWVLFFCAVSLSYWLWRHPNAARMSPIALATLATTLLLGFMLG